MQDIPAGLKELQTSAKQVKPIKHFIYCHHFPVNFLNIVATTSFRIIVVLKVFKWTLPCLKPQWRETRYFARNKFSSSAFHKICQVLYDKYLLS